MKLPNTLKEMLWLILLFLICAFTVCWQEAKGGLVKVRADLQVCVGTPFCQHQTSYGSGVVVGDFNGRSIVLSAGHVLQGHDRQGLPVNNATMRRLLVNGFPAKVVATWVDAEKPIDFCILLVEHKFMETTPLGNPPVEGENITIMGWDYSVRSTPKLVQKSGKVVSVKPREMTQVDFASASGISGGPVTNKLGNLVGILVHTSGIMPNFDFRKSILSFMRDANLPPPNVARYVREVPPPKDVPKPPEDSKVEEKLRAEIAALKKAADALKKAAAEKAAQGETAPLPPEEKVESTPEQPEEEPGFKEKALSAGGKALDAAEVGLGFADRALSNPLVIAALTATGLGTGLVGAKAGVSMGSALLAWRRRRKDEQIVVEDEKPKETPPPVAKAVGPVEDKRVDQIIDYLKDKESTCDLDVNELAESVSGLLVTRELQADGKTTEDQLWKDGVRLAKEGALQLNVLGGKQVAKSIEDFVHREKAKQDGTAIT